MFGKLWKKCVNYETISYLVCGVLTTAVDFVSYTAFRKMSMGVGVSQTLSWVAAVLFAYIVNKIIVFRNFNMGPAYLLKEGGAFFAARAISGVATSALLKKNSFESSLWVEPIDFTSNLSSRLRSLYTQ